MENSKIFMEKTTGLTTGSISKDLKVFAKIEPETKESVVFHFWAILTIVLSALCASIFAADFFLVWDISGWVYSLVITFLFGIIMTGSITLVRLSKAMQI